MWIVTTCTTDIRAASASAVPFLVLFGVVAGGWQMARAALAEREKIVAGEGDPFFTAKIVTARFFADHLPAQADGLASTVADGVSGVMGLADSQY